MGGYMVLMLEALSDAGLVDVDGDGTTVDVRDRRGPVFPHHVFGDDGEFLGLVGVTEPVTASGVTSAS